MVKPQLRSHSQARKMRTTPGHQNSIIYRRRKPNRAKCGLCGAILGGVPTERPTKMKKIPKVSKRPERQYGGRICPNCLKNSLVELSKDL